MAVHVTGFPAISFSELNQWVTVDLGAVAAPPTGATFAIVQFDGSNSSSTEDTEAGIRAVGDTIASVDTSRHREAYNAVIVELNQDNEVQLFRQSTNYTFRLLGYGDEITWLENYVHLNPTLSTSTFSTVDLSSHLPADAKYAVIRHHEARLNFRAVGDSLDVSSNSRGRSRHSFTIVELNAAREVQVNPYSTAAPNFFIVGWIGEGGYKYINAPTGRANTVESTWETYPDTDADLAFAMVAGDNGSATQGADFRPADGSYVLQNGKLFWAHAFVPVQNGEFQFRSSSALPDRWLRGGFLLEPAGGEPEPDAGVVLEDIKAPNEPDALVPDATGVEVAIWYATNKNGAPDYFTTTATITGGKLVVDLSGEASPPDVQADGIVEVYWLADVGGGFEDRYFSKRGGIFSDISGEIE
jgi:hypothetical protein